MRGKPAVVKCRTCQDINNISATGAKKIVARYGKQSRVQLVQLTHTCGQLWWTNHPDALKMQAQVEESSQAAAVASIEQIATVG